MRWFRNLSTFAKLLIAFGLLAAIMGAMGWLAVSELETMQANMDNLYNKQMVPIAVLSDVENDLQKVVPREKWRHAHHWLILHGRAICKAPVPRCGICPVNKFCPTPPIIAKVTLRQAQGRLTQRGRSKT